MVYTQKTLFSVDECDNIINLQKNNLQDWKFYGRDYQSESITLNNETNWIFIKLKSFFESETNLKIKRLHNIIHFHKYKVGDYFGRHDDVKANRLYAVGALLNENFEGGDFKLYVPNEITLNKKTGNTYIFDVNIEHEIEPIKSNFRYSILWFLTLDNIEKKISKLL